MTDYPTPGVTRTGWAQQLVDAIDEETAGTELDYSSVASTFTTTATTAGASAIITGLSCDFVGSGRTVEVSFFAPNCYHSVANTVLTFYTLVNGVALTSECQLGVCSSPSTSIGSTMMLTRRFIATNLAAYNITVGVYGAAAGTTTLSAAGFAVIELAVTAR
jgi:hypothetical protein